MLAGGGESLDSVFHLMIAHELRRPVSSFTSERYGKERILRMRSVCPFFSFATLVLPGTLRRQHCAPLSNSWPSNLLPALALQHATRH